MQETATRHPPVEAAAGDGKGSGPWLSMPRLWLIMVLGAIGLMALARVPSAIDLAYHVKVGELMVAEGALPRTDALAWTTAGRPWLDQNWGAQLVLYGIWRLGGSRLWSSSTRWLRWPPGHWWRRRVAGGRPTCG